MMCDVIVSKENNKYIARAKDWPTIVAENEDRNRALEQVKNELINFLTNQEIVQIEVPLPSATGNPWLDKLGWFKDDPTFDTIQDEIAAYRQEIAQAAAA